MRVQKYEYRNHAMEMVDCPNDQVLYVSYLDFLILYETAQKLADALDKMPIISAGHLKIKDEALEEFLDNTLTP